MTRCDCPASKTETGRQINWKRIHRVTATRWRIKCLVCGAVWESEAKYVEKLQEGE